MTKQLSKIQSFVASVVNNDFSEGQQSMILSADLEVVGGDNSKCENAAVESCSATNGKCTNSGNCGTSNGDCSNKPVLIQPGRNPCL